MLCYFTKVWNVLTRYVIGSGYPSGSRTTIYVGYPSSSSAGRIAYISYRLAVVPDG